MTVDMVDFDIIRGSWLSLYHVVLDYYAKEITIAMSGMSRLEWRSNCSPVPKKDHIFSLCH